MKRKINIKDILLGLTMISLSLYIFVGGNVITGKSILKESILIGRAEFYIKFLATIMLIISLAIIVKSFLASGNEEKDKDSINKLAIFSFLALIVYTFLLKPIGFFLSSFILMTFLCLAIMVEEKGIDIKNKKMMAKSLAISCLFSLVSVLSIMYIFTKWLKVILP